MKYDFILDHIALSVSNLDRTIQWYSNVFGFEKIREFDKPYFKVKGAIMKLGDIKLEIFEPYKPNPLPENNKTLESNLQTLGNKHFALKVDDLESAYEEMKKKGVEFLSEIWKGSTSKLVFCKDPEGILIELKEDL